MSRLLQPAAALVAVLLLPASCLATTPPKSAHAKARQAKAAKPEPLRSQPPPTPEQLPPSPPVVSYTAGQLSILANNSTLAAVLDQVRLQTGATIAMTGVAPSDRVYLKLGPGAPKDVIAALLDGSRFNYAILGSETDPNAVRSIVLLPKAGAGSPAVGSSSPLAPAVRAGNPAAQDDEDAPPEDEQPMPAVDEPQPQPVPNQGDPIAPTQPGQVKTPEQLLQELQQMQQQQQQPQPNPPPNPNPQDPQ